jgi:hypothetical protein
MINNKPPKQKNKLNQEQAAALNESLVKVTDTEDRDVSAIEMDKRTVLREELMENLFNYLHISK